MDENRARGLTLWGTVVAVAGVVVMLFYYGGSSDGHSFVGGVLVLSGLLLRIEGAVRAGRVGASSTVDR